jgi:RNA polymerase sigma-70 factor (ECF subfamily)
MSASRPDLASLFALGRRAWPQVELSLEELGRAFGDRRVAEEKAADVFLACACAVRAPGALDAFDRAYLSDVRALIGKLRPSDAFADEVRQALREKLFVGGAGAPGRIAEYNGDGALANWVRVTALRTAIDLQRQHRPPVEPKRTLEDPARADPELQHVKQRYRKPFNDAFRRALAALTAEQRALLKEHYVDGATLEELAKSLGVHRATAARRLATVRLTVLDEARRILSEELGTTSSELESLVRVMRSQIDLTLSGLLTS